MATVAGLAPIQSLHVGQRVLAENTATGQVAPEPVQEVIADPVSPLIAVELSDGSAIAVTADHPFWVDAGAWLVSPGWLPAEELRMGDHLRTANGLAMLVVGLRRNVGRAVVYTLTVAQDHTYFVGSAHVLVHNSLPFACRPSVSDPDLKAILDRVWRSGSSLVGNGSTADAVHYELRYGRRTGEDCISSKPGSASLNSVNG